MKDITKQIRSKNLVLERGMLTVYFCDIPQDDQKIVEFIQANIAFLSPHLITAKPKRQAEFIAGRLASNAALEALGINNQMVPSNSDRSPQWPEGVAGAISHKTTLAAAAAAASTDYDLIGLDLENTFSPKTISRVSRKIIYGNEEQIILAAPYSYPEAFTQVFSAKESLYKAVYPYVQRYLGFDTSEVIEMTAHYLLLQLREDVAREVPGSPLFKAHIIPVEEHILTLTTGTQKI